jgi:hypothetical protein
MEKTEGHEHAEIQNLVLEIEAAGGAPVGERKPFDGGDFFREKCAVGEEVQRP